MALGWVRTDDDYLWLQVGVPSGNWCRWIWINQAGQEGESDFRLRADGAIEGTWWYRAIGKKNESLMVRGAGGAGGSPITASAREAFQAIPGRAERDVFKTDADLAAWMDKTLRELGLAGKGAPKAEYAFGRDDLKGMGAFEKRAAPDGSNCWILPRTLEKGEMLANYVEIQFEAEAGKTYRCWVRVGGCCLETLQFYAQVSGLEVPDPSQAGRKLSVEPGGTAAFPPPVSAGTTARTHAQHRGPALPASWKWVRVELPPSYPAGGTQRVWILGDREGFAVREAVVSSTRTTSP